MVTSAKGCHVTGGGLEFIAGWNGSLCNTVRGRAGLHNARTFGRRATGGG